MQAVSLLPVYYGKYQKINSYHALYFGALKVLPNTEAVSIQSIGGKYECIGVSVFSPLGQKCMEKTNTSYADVVKLIGNHPSVGVRVILKLFEDGRETRLEYLGKGIKNTPNFSESSVL